MIVVLVVVGVLLFIGLVVAANSVHILRERAGCRVSPWSPPRVARPGGVCCWRRSSIGWCECACGWSRSRCRLRRSSPEATFRRGSLRERISVIDPKKSIAEIQDVLAATSQIAQTDLR